MLEGCSDGFDGFATGSGQFANLFGNHAETAPLFTDPCSFDRCIQAKQIGLSGNVFYKGKYRNGEGSVVSYFSSGELKFEGNYKLRKKEGTWKYFDKSGNIVATEIYNNGILQY